MTAVPDKGRVVMKRIAAAGLVVVGCFANQALAQQPYRGWFAGISAGQSSADIDSSSSLRILGAPASTLSSDDTDTGFRLYGGYRFNRHLAVEIGYADLGTFTATRSINPPGVPGAVRGTFDVRGTYGQAVGII